MRDVRLFGHQILFAKLSIRALEQNILGPMKLTRETFPTGRHSSFSATFVYRAGKELTAPECTSSQGPFAVVYI